jgi:pyruvate,water dikinase
MRFLYLFLLTIFSVQLPAQAIYTGKIKDVATGEVVSDVKVEIKGRSLSTTSNAFGDFLIQSPVESRQQDPVPHYAFFYNTLLWNTQVQIELQLFGIDGRRIYHVPDLGNGGSYILPQLPYGIYVLRLRTDLDEQAFKLFSDGERTQVADHKKTPYTYAEAGLDSLRFTKEGYFPREIALPRQDTLLDLYMMQGNYENLLYLNDLIDPLAFDLVSSSPSRTNFGHVKAVKIMYNIEDGKMYYQNTKAFQYHYFFARDVLGFNQGNYIFNQTQYLENPNRYLYPANLNYYEDLDVYVLQLVAINEMSCEHLKTVFDKILETSYLGDKLFFFSNKPEWDDCAVPQISSETLYQGQNYQALNLAENYGYLQKVKLQDQEETYLGRRDIVLLDGIPNDVSVVAGIITTEFQTPLSHINVLSNSRGTPNMALRDGWTSPQLENLMGELVYFKVASDSFTLRKASLAEATAFWSQNEPQDTVYLAKDVETAGLIDLHAVDHSAVNLIGGKAANFAEMLRVNENGLSIPVPENYFAIPFYYYDRHLQKSGLDEFVAQMLADPVFQSDPVCRKATLERLRDSIEEVPIDPVLVFLVNEAIDDFAEFPAYRFRSSTNAEDLEDFSGAGLYDSKSAKKGDSKKTVARAIKKVWASLWNWRAFEERSYYKIDHQSCAMGILVHRSFPDEDANGVVVTTNLYNDNPGFIINVQYQEYSIVFPEPGILHDQIMLLAWSIDPEEDFMIEYLTFSNVPELNGERVMTDAELFELGAYCMALKQHYYSQVPHNCACSFDDFALDIEFKLDSEVSPRKIYVKQARRFQ